MQQQQIIAPRDRTRGAVVTSQRFTASCLVPTHFMHLRSNQAALNASQVFAPRRDAHSEGCIGSRKRSRRLLRCNVQLDSVTGRRQLFKEFAGAMLAAQLLRVDQAEASLVMMPATELNNTYYLLRAGESESEAEGSIDTNPVNKTSMSNGLSEAGKRQILQETLPTLQEWGVCREECWLWPSTTQNAYQTAEILAYAFQIGRERIVPEYSFLDMRGVGNFDGLSPEEAYSNIHEIDSQGASLRPPPTTTGTPNESAMDVLVRVRQLISVLETLYLNSEVVVISPDSENLSVLQTAILGEASATHWNRAFRPGECRKLELAATRMERKSFVMDCPRPPNCM